MALKAKVKENAIKGLAGLVLITGLSGCGSISNMFNDTSRDFVKRDYQIKLYSADGKVIMNKTVNNTYIQLGENGSGIRYVDNGKLEMLNGTYVVREK